MDFFKKKKRKKKKRRRELRVNSFYLSVTKQRRLWLGLGFRVRVGPYRLRVSIDPFQLFLSSGLVRFMSLKFDSDPSDTLLNIIKFYHFNKKINLFNFEFIILTQ